MNKAITDGLLLMPPPFSAGLAQWSSADGTVGSPSYFGAPNAALVPADQDFGGCLELLKTVATQKLRYFGQTPILPGCYLRVTARVKQVSGNFCSVRIAGWAGGAGDVNVAGVPQTAASTTLTTYGEIKTITAIIGSGNRTGVDMVWGTAPISGHFGIDLTGATGGTVRIDDITIEDVTSVFQRVMMDIVDVRDYGAIGNGVTADHAAFALADAAAAGRTVLVSKGTYFLGDHVTFSNPVRFEGTVTMPVDKRLALTRNFDLPTYDKAFGGEVLGFQKAVQALFNFSDHVSLDLCGRRIEVNGPINIWASVNNIDTFAQRRIIHNGEFSANANAAWTTDTVTSQANYATNAPYTLSGVTNVANIQVGSLVTGNGVGREVYVRSKNVGAATVTLSLPLFAAAGTQVFTFKRFKYILDFSGFAQLDRMELNNIDFLCNGEASTVMLPAVGQTFRISDCVFNKPKDRGITSIGVGCQGMFVDDCQFLSNEQAARVQDRTTIALNVNANDTKIRNNKTVRFAHFAVLAGQGHMMIGNHFFHGDAETLGLRRAGLVLTDTNVKMTITGNYIDNSFIEWSNEHDPAPEFNNEFSFGGLTITSNIFTVNDVVPWFSWIVITPRGPGHYIQGLNISGNTFRTVNTPVDRVETVDTSFANLDFSRMRNITVAANSFNGVVTAMQNPVMIEHLQTTAASAWTVSTGGALPFGCFARSVQSVVAEGVINGPGSETRSDMPYVTVEQGAAKDQVRLTFANPSRGRVHVAIRGDAPN